MTFSNLRLAILGFLWLIGTGTTLAIAQPQGKVITQEIQATSLDKNLVETPLGQNVAIYLPPRYQTNPERRFPTLYLLHGIFDSFEVWTENYDVPGMLDRLIASGEIDEVILVMPNGGNRYGGGYYRNSPVSGNWADYISEDLVNFIDANWRSIAQADARAVVGHSMGGFGAIHLAMERPDVFSVAWGMSPCCLAPVRDLGFGNDAWKRVAQVENASDIQAFFQNRDFYPIVFLGLLAAFAEEEEIINGPVPVKLPFAISRGEFQPDLDAIARYEANFPVNRIEERRSNLRNLKGLALDFGLHEQFLHIPAGSLAFSQELAAQGIPHLLDVYAGDHRNKVAGRLEDIVLPWVVDRLAGPQ